MLSDPFALLLLACFVMASRCCANVPSCAGRDSRQNEDIITMLIFPIIMTSRR